MALTTTTEWDVRTGGNDANGGAFDITGTGTDYSLQDAAQIAFTDLVIGGTTTQLTSAGNPFTSAHVGNVINITGGTGFTTGRYVIVSVGGSTATMDRSVGTGGSTGGTGNLGGAMATIQGAYDAAIAARVVAGTDLIFNIHVKSGTYTFTSTKTLTGNSLVWIGYGSAHRDFGTQPLVTTATNSTDLFNTSASLHVWINFSFSNTAATRAKCFTANNGSLVDSWYWENCTFDGFSTAIFGDWTSTWSFRWSSLRYCEIKNCTTRSIDNTYGMEIIGCKIHDNAGSVRTGTHATVGSGTLMRVYRSLIVDNTGNGLEDTPNTNAALRNWDIEQCTIANNTADGFAWTSTNTSYAQQGQPRQNIPAIGATGGLRPTVRMVNNIIYGNGGFGRSFGASGAVMFYERKNAYGSNSSGNHSNVAAGPDDIALSADPFTNAAAGDYSLNNTAGGGAAVRDAAYYPW